MIFHDLIVSVFSSHYAPIQIRFNAHSFNECLRHLSYPEIVFAWTIYNGANYVNAYSLSRVCNRYTVRE